MNRLINDENMTACVGAVKDLAQYEALVADLEKEAKNCITPYHFVADRLEVELKSLIDDLPAHVRGDWYKETHLKLIKYIENRRRLNG